MSFTPLVSYPTNIAFIDDDLLFLQVLKSHFQKKFKMNIFNCPIEGTEYFKNYKAYSSSVTFLKASTSHEEYDRVNHLPIDINLKSLSNLRADQNRYEDTSVIIVDFNMPGMTGIEVCKTLQKIPCKKILLTGSADYQNAVKAFNDGIIDFFISKDDPKLLETLHKNIIKLQNCYFQEMTLPLLTHLEADYKLPQSDPIFSEFFENWCEQNQITEFYLNNKNGNYVVINQDNQHQFFVIHTDKTLNSFIDFYSEDIETDPFIQSLETRNKIPFFGEQTEAWQVEYSEWDQYFYEPNLLIGREKYYWKVVDREN